MSRCFPFPPPGYEQKARDNSVDLLAKERHKERKHKKDKKDREKKDKKDAEKPKDKHRDKKDRKEKSRDRKKGKDKGKTTEKIDVPCRSHHEEKGENSQQADEIKDSNLLVELGKRVGVGTMCGSQILGDFTDSAHRRIGEGRLLTEKEGKANDGRGEHWLQERGEDRFSGNVISHGLLDHNQIRHETMTRLSEKILVKSDQRKEEVDEGEDGERYRNREGNKTKLHEKGKEKTERGSYKQRENEKFSREVEQTSCHVIDRSFKGGERGAYPDENLRKRKELESNGFRNENDAWSNKLPVRVENGRKLEAFHVTIPCASDREQAFNCREADSQVTKSRANGVIAGPSSIPSSTNMRASVTLEPKSEGQASLAKPPHPDSKYLSQIYSVPKMDELLDIDCDQEWLFHGDNQLRPKPKASELEPPVWAEGKHVGSADIYALPYVIPY